MVASGRRSYSGPADSRGSSGPAVQHISGAYLSGPAQHISRVCTLSGPAVQHISRGAYRAGGTTSVGGVLRAWGHYGTCHHQSVIRYWILMGPWRFGIIRWEAWDLESSSLSWDVVCMGLCGMHVGSGWWDDTVSGWLWHMGGFCGMLSVVAPWGDSGICWGVVGCAGPVDYWGCCVCWMGGGPGGLCVCWMGGGPGGLCCMMVCWMGGGPGGLSGGVVGWLAYWGCVGLVWVGFCQGLCQARGLYPL